MLLLSYEDFVEEVKAEMNGYEEIEEADCSGRDLRGLAVFIIGARADADIRVPLFSVLTGEETMGPGGFANALRDQRFLSEEAPRLPISGCDASSCECLLMPSDDRRGSQDRRTRFSPLAGYEPDLQAPKTSRQGDRREDEDEDED